MATNERTDGRDVRWQQMSVQNTLNTLNTFCVVNDQHCWIDCVTFKTKNIYLIVLLYEMAAD
jgi:hypothetical protein